MNIDSNPTKENFVSERCDARESCEPVFFSGEHANGSGAPSLEIGNWHKDKDNKKNALKNDEAIKRNWGAKASRSIERASGCDPMTELEVTNKKNLHSNEFEDENLTNGLIKKSHYEVLNEFNEKDKKKNDLKNSEDITHNTIVNRNKFNDKNLTNALNNSEDIQQNLDEQVSDCKVISEFGNTNIESIQLNDIHKTHSRNIMIDKSSCEVSHEFSCGNLRKIRTENGLSNSIPV
jgi:hypothetical protein